MGKNHKSGLCRPLDHRQHFPPPRSSSGKKMNLNATKNIPYIRFRDPVNR